MPDFVVFICKVYYLQLTNGELIQWSGSIGIYTSVKFKHRVIYLHQTNQVTIQVALVCNYLRYVLQNKSVGVRSVYVL